MSITNSQQKPFVLADVSVTKSLIALAPGPPPLPCKAKAEGATSNGSKSKSDRLKLLEKCDYIFFNSKWTKKQFFIDIGFDKAMNNSEGNLIEFDYRTSIGGYTKK